MNSECSMNERLQKVVDCKKIARYYETVRGTYRVQVLGIFSTEGTDWGGYFNTLSTTGKTLEEAKANLVTLCQKECVPGFKIDEWREHEYCPLVYNHHVGSTCSCCGLKG